VSLGLLTSVENEMAGGCRQWAAWGLGPAMVIARYSHDNGWWRRNHSGWCCGEQATRPKTQAQSDLEPSTKLCSVRSGLDDNPTLPQLHDRPALTMSDMERSPSPEFSPLAFGEDLAPLPEYKSAGTTAVDFSGLLGEPLKLHEDLKAGCGGQLWPAGMVLAKHMLRYHRDRLQHARMSVPETVTAHGRRGARLCSAAG
jgi:hypothetical protein